MTELVNIREILDLCLVGLIVGVVLGWIAVPWVLYMPLIKRIISIFAAVTISWILIFVVFGSTDDGYSPKRYSVNGFIVGILSSISAILMMELLNYYIFRIIV